MIALSPAPLPKPRKSALTLPPVRQQLNLAVAVGGSLGGAILLSSNLVYIALAPVTLGAAWIPLTANVALLFGSAMFAREYRRNPGASEAR